MIHNSFIMNNESDVDFASPLFSHFYLSQTVWIAFICFIHMKLIKK